MPSLLCPAFLVLLCACSQLFLARSETARSCLEEHAFPIASARNCTVVNSSLSLLSNSNEVHLTWRDHACRRKVIGASVCPGYAGMELTFQCDLEGTYLYSVIENKAMGPKAYFSMLLPKHDGEYQCRRYSNNETVSVYNITVIAGKYTYIKINFSHIYPPAELCMSRSGFSRFIAQSPPGLRPFDYRYAINPLNPSSSCFTKVH